MRNPFTSMGLWFVEDPRRLQLVFLVIATLTAVLSLVGILPSEVMMIADPSGGGAGGGGGMV